MSDRHNIGITWKRTFWSFRPDFPSPINYGNISEMPKINFALSISTRSWLFRDMGENTTGQWIIFQSKYNIAASSFFTLKAEGDFDGAPRKKAVKLFPDERDSNSRPNNHKSNLNRDRYRGDRGGIGGRLSRRRLNPCNRPRRGLALFDGAAQSGLQLQLQNRNLFENIALWKRHIRYYHHKFSWQKKQNV